MSRKWRKKSEGGTFRYLRMVREQLPQECDMKRIVWRGFSVLERGLEKKHSHAGFSDPDIREIMEKSLKLQGFKSVELIEIVSIFFIFDSLGRRRRAPFGRPSTSPYLGLHFFNTFQHLQNCQKRTKPLQLECFNSHEFSWNSQLSGSQNPAWECFFSNPSKGAV